VDDEQVLLDLVVDAAEARLFPGHAREVVDVFPGAAADVGDDLPALL